MTKSDEKSMSFIVYDLSTSEKNDNRQELTEKTLNEDELINLTVSEYPDLDIDTIKSILLKLKFVAIKQIEKGEPVTFHLGNYKLVINGAYFSENDNSDCSSYVCKVHGKRLAAATVDIRGLS